MYFLSCSDGNESFLELFLCNIRHKVICSLYGCHGDNENVSLCFNFLFLLYDMRCGSVWSFFFLWSIIFNSYTVIVFIFVFTQYKWRLGHSPLNSEKKHSGTPFDMGSFQFYFYLHLNVVVSSSWVTMVTCIWGSLVIFQWLMNSRPSVLQMTPPTPPPTSSSMSSSSSSSSFFRVKELWNICHYHYLTFWWKLF